MEATPDAIALLRALVEAQAETNALLRRIVGSRDHEDADLSLILRAAFTVLGPEAFTLARLVELSKSPLRMPLLRAVNGRSVKQLSKLFAAGAGRAIDKLRLERVGRGRPAVYRLIDLSNPGSPVWNHRGR